MEYISKEELNKIGELLGSTTLNNNQSKEKLLKKLVLLAYGYEGITYEAKEAKFQSLEKTHGQKKVFLSAIVEKYKEISLKEYVKDLSQADIYKIDERNIETVSSSLKRELKPNVGDKHNTGKKTENYDIKKLKGLISILVAMYKDIIDSISTKPKSSVTPHQDNNKWSDNKLIRLLIYLFPSTGLPSLFIPALSLGLDIKIRKSQGWDAVKTFLENGHSDAALHSLSNAVVIDALNNNDDNLIFFPLLKFSGYRIIIRKSLLVGVENFNTIGELFDSKIWFESIEKESIEVEGEEVKINSFCAHKNTDLHYVAKKFFKKSLGNKIKELDDQIFDRKFKDYSHPEQFMNDTNALFYVTNWVYANHFKDDEDYIIVSDNHYINHSNLNGVFFYSKFFKKTYISFFRLLQNWHDSLDKMTIDFARIKEIEENKNRINKAKVFSELNYIDKYCDELSEELKIKINRFDLAKNLKEENYFFKNHSEAIDELDALLKDGDMLNRYVNLANVNLGKFNNEGNKKIKVEYFIKIIENTKKMINEK